MEGGRDRRGLSLPLLPQPVPDLAVHRHRDAAALGGGGDEAGRRAAEVEAGEGACWAAGAGVAR